MEYVETVIIGAGQAGLATAHRLRKRGRDCVVLDHNQRIGDNWRQQWDSLRLYSPAKFDGLPGMRFPADPWSFPTKDDVAAYLESYAGRWDLPVRLGVWVEGLSLVSVLLIVRRVMSSMLLCTGLGYYPCWVGIRGQ